MSDLVSIEKHFGVQLPSAYRQWFEKPYINHKRNEAEYLWVYDGEWVPPDDFIKFDTGRDRLIPGLIPFAFTGNGSSWAWNSSQTTEPGEFEILLCNHDEELADVYAPTFAAWFYRLCLEYAVVGIENEYKEIEKARVQLQLWSTRMEELGKSKWAEHLLMLSAAEPVKYENFVPSPGIPSPQFSLTTDEQVNAVVRDELGERYIDTQTEWGWYTDE